MMRQQTALPHEYIDVGRLWNGKTGNYDKDSKPKDLIVLHSMAGSMQGTIAHFSNPATIPSAHYGIGYDGRIVQFLPEDVTSYNAGVYSVNQRSISLENEDFGNNQAVRPEVLYDTNSKLVADISMAWGIPLDREHVKIHRDFVNTACPGNLDIDRIIRQARIIAQQARPAAATGTIGVDPTVFTNVVTKSSEYDEVWKALRLPEELKGNVGSHKVVLDAINQRITEAAMRATTPPTATPAPQVPAPSPAIESPSVQSVPLLKKDVWEMLKALFGRRKRGVTVNA
jgi:N-acetylmuramoyl-L-alanine amidase CwlA